MPQWIHSRAKHLLARNPDMEKSTAFAIATNQAHKLGKTSKGFGTRQAKSRAKDIYDKPKKEYEQKANPENLKTPKLASVAALVVAELKKEAFTKSQYSGPLGPGSMKYHSSLPAFSAPPVKTAGPPPPKAKLAAPITPQAKLQQSKSVGAPRTTAPPGPSIAQIAKPKGFGKPIPGAIKTVR